MEHIRTTLPKTATKVCAPTVSTVLDSGELVEMVYDTASERSALCVGGRHGARLEAGIRTKHGRLVPYNGSNNLLRSQVVLFPLQPEDYDSEHDLVVAIEAFIHRYVDVSPLFERLSAYYVLFSWIFDSFNELPYLRLLGDPGSGKTRFLLTVGALCYKPMFASGASTVSPLFRLIDTFQGTLIVDEADFRLSDERAEIVKILNNGNGRGFPVLRAEASPNGREFNPRAYAVFGPKIVATRQRFQDPALESRCLTEEMGQRPLRSDVPINLPSTYKSEALALRNQLLTFRLRHGGRPITIHEQLDPAIEPRLNQVFAPLLTLIEDPVTRQELIALARLYNDDILAERGQATEARVLEVIRDLQEAALTLSMSAIAAAFAQRHGAEYERTITARWIGDFLRRKLRLRTHKTSGQFVLTVDSVRLLPMLFGRYGVRTPAAAEDRRFVDQHPVQHP